MLSKLTTLISHLEAVGQACPGPHDEALDDLLESLDTFALRIELDCMWAVGHWEALDESIGWTREFLNEVEPHLDIKDWPLVQRARLALPLPTHIS